MKPRARTGRPLLGVLALIALLGAGTLTAGPADGGHLKKCGSAVKSGAGAYDVRATNNVRCRTAKRVASRFYPGGERRFNNWRCSGKAVGYESGEGRCKRFGNQRPRQLVKFLFGA